MSVKKIKDKLEDEVLEEKDETSDKEVKDEESKTEEVEDKDTSEKEDSPTEENESTEDEKAESDKTDESEKEDEVDTSEKVEEDNSEDEKSEEKETENTVMFEDGWFDEASGEINVDKIKNPEALAAIQMLINKYTNEKQQRLINDSINEEIKKYSLNVSEDTLKKVLDTSGVKIDEEGKVVGVKEALEALKTAEPGFFKDKDKESNPLNEGFNPVVKKNTGNLNSFSQAFRLMDEIQ